MGHYQDEPYKILCGTKGIDNNSNVNAIKSNALLPASKNIGLTRGGWEPRKGTAKINGTVIVDAPRIMGMYDFLKIGGAQHIVFSTNDGKIYKNSTTTIKTGLGANKYACFSMYNNVMFFCNGYNIPQTWNGVAGATSNLANVPSDWAGTNYPAVMIRHGRGNSERMWAFGCPSNPYTVYVSPSGDGQDFSDANVSTFSIDTGDDAGIVGGTVYRDRLIMFGKRKTFVMDDADTDVTNWGYGAFAREGGVAHQRLIIPTLNDVILMMEDGEIYSLIAAQEYGDYKMASITQSNFINEWIQSNVRLSYIEHFHGIYDPIRKAVKIFVVRTGQTEVDTALIYNTKIGEWTIENNVSSNSGYSASTSALIKVSPGVYEIYTGDYSGYIWHLEQSTKNDDSNSYTSKVLTPYLYFDNSRISKLYHRCWISFKPGMTCDLVVKCYVNEVLVKTATITAEGATRISFSIGKIGEVIQFEFANAIVDKDFFITQIMIDFQALGYQVA